MSSSVVFIFLLDNLPANILNEPLELTLPHTKQYSAIKTNHCDHVMDTQPILESINKILKIKLTPQWSRELPKEYSCNTSGTNNIETVDNSVDYENSGMYENDRSYLENTNIEQELFEDKSECDSENNKNTTYNNFVKSSKTSVTFPKSAPFLVAIFESVGNITAQTCGGTVLSPRWVLTAASCLNMLSSVYNNITEKSHYTVVANSTNPFLDGNTHMVTEVHLHPRPKRLPDVQSLIQHLHLPDDMAQNLTRRKESLESKGPALALMRVEPAMDVGAVELAEHDLGSEDAMVYGWELVKNDSGQDAMRVTSFPSRILPPLECSTRYNVSDASMICLTPSNDTNKHITQLSLGGTVLVIQNREAGVLGVAQTDDRAPCMAHRVTTHRSWIRRLLDSE